MKLIYVPYKDAWKLTYRDPWSGRPRIKTWKGKEAEGEAQAFATAIGEQYEREREIIRRTRRRRASVASGRLTVAELLRLYFASLQNPQTRASVRYHADSLVGIFGSRKAHRLTLDDVDAWMEIERGRGCTQATVNRRAGILRAAYNWGVKARHLSGTPLSGLRLPKLRQRRLSPPSVQEARLIYDAAAQHVRRVVVLGMATGARIGPSELFRLRWSDIDIDGGVIRMPNANKGAQNEARDVPIRDDIRDLLRKWRAEDAGNPWVITYRSKPVKSISKAWHGALRRAGITRQINPYLLRHAFASLALAHGADLKSVAETMGHADARMLLSVYQHTLFEQRRAAVNAAPGIFSNPDAKNRRKRISGRGGGGSNAPTGPATTRRTTAPRTERDPSVEYPPVYGSQSGREHVIASRDGCGGAREGQPNDGVCGQGNQVRQVRPLVGNGNGT